jgi:hypothetical protein
MALEEKQKRLNDELRKRKLKAGILENSNIETDALLETWQHGNIEERKKVSRKYIEQINIKDDNEIEIIWRVPE